MSAGATLQKEGAVRSPFDAMAADYDAAFTHSPIGVRMRQAVWRRLDARFLPGDRILELNCGTGEDALYLAKGGRSVLATDVSPAMVEVARAKAEREGLTDRIVVHPLAIEALDAATVCGVGPVFDGALSNFGGLNCVADWRDTAARLAACLRPGGFALLCVMGPLCPWEWAWYLLQGKPGKAFRRLKPGGVAWRGLTIRYPSIAQMRSAFRPYFRCVRVSAVGALVPPTYADAWAARRPRLLARLDAWERRCETWPLVPALADHYLLELERVERGVCDASLGTTP